jgi:hypothetical protein
MTALTECTQYPREFMLSAYRAVRVSLGPPVAVSIARFYEEMPCFDDYDTYVYSMALSD